MKSVLAPKAAIVPTQPAVGIFCRVNGVLGLIARRWTRLSVIATAGVSARIGNSKARQFGTNAQVTALANYSRAIERLPVGGIRVEKGRSFVGHHLFQDRGDRLALGEPLLPDFGEQPGRSDRER
jgi:hypothetical protein